MWNIERKKLVVNYFGLLWQQNHFRWIRKYGKNSNFNFIITKNALCPLPYTLYII